MLDSKIQEAIGNLILTYGEDNARALWIETCGFKVDVLITMAEYDKSGVVPVNTLLESMVLLRNLPDPYDNGELPLNVDICDGAPLATYEKILAISINDYGENATRLLLRRQEAEQRWDNLMAECDIKIIKAMKKRYRRDSETCKDTE